MTAGYRSGAEPVVETNVLGTLNSLEAARRRDAAFVLLSTSRVYPHSTLNALEHAETESRYLLREPQGVDGLSAAGIAESFPLGGIRSLYGACKLAAELIVHEYLVMYNLRGLINRCSAVAGPWQMAKADQGFVTLWVAPHVLGGPLSYLGFEGTGKQVRDVLHVDDLYRALERRVQEEAPTVPAKAIGRIVQATAGADADHGAMDCFDRPTAPMGRVGLVYPSQAEGESDPQLRAHPTRATLDQQGPDPLGSEVFVIHRAVSTAAVGDDDVARNPGVLHPRQLRPDSRPLVDDGYQHSEPGPSSREFEDLGRGDLPGRFVDRWSRTVVGADG